MQKIKINKINKTKINTKINNMKLINKKNKNIERINYRKFKSFFFVLSFGLLLIVAGCSKNLTYKEKVASFPKGTIVVFKSAQCGCCVGYISELKKNGYSVETVLTESDDLAAIKEDNSIPLNIRSCHTAFVDNYFIEGHVPLEAVKKLLTEKPDVDGIILPRMPAGSLGMPGVKDKPFDVLSIKDGKTSEFMKI